MSRSIQLGNRSYEINEDDFLENPYTWDENFAERMTDSVNIPGELTPSHWKVINFIRGTFTRTGRCPAVYQTLKGLDLRLKDLKKLFPTGYLRGACKLAGVNYMAQLFHPVWLVEKGEARVLERKVYRVDAQGFLIDPSEWDESFALFKSDELKMPVSLTDEHWRIIRYLRERFEQNGTVPTVYETCEDNKLMIEDLERLFPDGYHRGAVKISGLRAI
jgi:tRNA 2-thiouridine synthesizing protein E